MSERAASVLEGGGLLNAAEDGVEGRAEDVTDPHVVMLPMMTMQAIARSSPSRTECH